MLFKPSTVACMWDTWLFFQDGVHYLFYLFNSRVDANWDGFGLATSKDGIHFTDHGPILRKAEDAVWFGTGMTWKVGNKYYVNFSELRAGHQEVHFAESKDLFHWNRLPGDEFACRLDPTWYAEVPALSPQRWDGIWVLPDDQSGGYLGYLTTIAKEGPRGLCGTAGMVVSQDGLHFTAAPPVIETGFWGDGVEVGAVEKIGSRYYMLLGIFHAPPGARHISRNPGGECGMVPLVAESPAGPFRLLDGQSIVIGSSPSVYTYFARFYRMGDDLLVNHHVVARTTPHVGFNAGPDVMFAPLKKAHVDENGLFSLRWWNGNDRLKDRRLAIDFSGNEYSRGVDQFSVQVNHSWMSAPANGFAFLPQHFNFHRGVVIEADLILEKSTNPLSSLGIFIESTTPGMGSLFTMQTNGLLCSGWFNGYSYKPEDHKTVELETVKPVQWRVLIRGPFIEIYLNQVHIQSYTMNQANSGRLACFVEGGAAIFKNFHAWEMPF